MLVVGASVRCSGTFSPGLGGCLWLLQGQQEAVQQVQEALQHPAVAQRSLANAGQQHEDPETTAKAKHQQQEPMLADTSMEDFTPLSHLGLIKEC